ncbi:MAG: hypothetical protein WA061_02480 [Microgenomates group bacterium]
MTIRKIKVEVVQTKEIEVELDDEIITDEFNADFRKYFYPFYDLEDHAEHLAQFRARFEDESFIEGYGHVLSDGQLIFSVVDYDREGNKIEPPVRRAFRGINVRVVDEDVETRIIE